MNRDQAIIGAALLAFCAAQTPAHAVGVTDATRNHHHPAEEIIKSPPGEAVDLTAREEQVSETAARAGDQTFLMVDKTLGKIILFEHDQPVFSGAALTGQSTADKLPAGALGEKFSQLNDLKDKVTPAGRFTVSFGRDNDYGPLLDINEIQGKDWGIAIHAVYLGIPAEHRADRLRSPGAADKHITYGCINVEPSTIHFLLKELATRRKTPLYILPEDETMTAAYFTAHNS